MDRINTVVKKIGGSDESEILKTAGRILKAGGLVAFPTETVYGLGGDALNPASAEKIYRAKGRPSDNPLIVHIDSLDRLPLITGGITAAVRLLAEHFWPGPLTLVLPKTGAVPPETTGGLPTVAVRMPVHPAALALIREAGGYVAAPSANLSGRPSPTLAKHVVEDLTGRVDLILDGGDARIGIESTIVDLTEEIPLLLRPGAVTEAMLRRLLPGILPDPALKRQLKAGERPRAPGMKYRHYAPKARLIIVEGREEAVVLEISQRVRKDQAAGKRPGVLAASETAGRYPPAVVKSLGKRSGEEAAGQLFKTLREFDDLGVDCIYSEAFAAEGIGQAVMNRLLKAAGYERIQLQELPV